MPQKYTDPTENAAWEIFVQLVWTRQDVDTAAPDTLTPVKLTFKLKPAPPIASISRTESRLHTRWRQRLSRFLTIWTITEPTRERCLITLKST
jgi:hypothetical protein